MRERLWIWRASPLVRLAPVVAVAGVMVAVINAKLVQPYWLDVSSKASVSVVFLAPGLAALAAFDAGRWRRARLGATTARGPLATVGATLAPAALTAFAVLVVATLVVALRSGVEPALPAVGPLALAFVVALAFTCVGVLLGRCLPTSYAVPLAFALAWLWLTFPQTVTPYWVRNINGNLGTSCCSMNLMLVDGAIAAPMGVAVAIGAAAVLVLGLRRQVVAVILAVALVSSAVILARSAMLTAGPDPVLPRRGATACSEGSPRVCVWPELERDLPALAAAVRRTAGRHRELGLPVPGAVTTESGIAGTWSVDLDPADRSVWPLQVSQAPLAGLPPTCLQTTNGRWPAGPVFGQVRLWLAAVAGTDLSNRPDLGSPDDVRVVAHLRTLSPATQVRWYQGNLAALASCDAAPTPVPAR